MAIIGGMCMQSKSQLAAEIDQLRDALDKWQGMYRVAAERAEKAEVELKRLTNRDMGNPEHCFTCGGTKWPNQCKCDDKRVAKRCAEIALTLAAEWDSDDVVTSKNYAGAAADKIVAEFNLSNVGQ